MESKNILKFLFFGTLLFLFFGCMDIGGSEEVVYAEYSDDYFSVKYPENWDVTTDELNYEPRIRFTSKLESSSDLLYEEFTVAVLDLSDDLESFEDFEEFERSLSYEFQEIISAEVITFNDFEALEIKKEDNEAGYPLGALTIIYFVKDDKVFRVSYGYEVSKESKYLPIFEEMLNSFEVNYDVGEELENIVYADYSDDYFSIKYPENWDVDSEESQGIFATYFDSKLESPNDLTYEGLYIEISDLTEDLNSFEDFEESEKSLLYESQKITSKEEITFNGFEALKINIDSNTPDYPSMKIVTVYFVKEDKVFRIAYNYETVKESKYLPMFEEMLDSFEVNYIAEEDFGTIQYTDYSSEYFSIKYPETWNSYEYESIYFESKLEGSNDYYYEGLIVSLYYATENFSTKDDFVEYEESILYEDEAIISVTDVEIGNYSGSKIEIEGANPPVENVKSVVVYFVNDGDVFRIAYAYEDNKKSKYLPIFEKMLDSFKIK